MPLIDFIRQNFFAFLITVVIVVVLILIVVLLIIAKANKSDRDELEKLVADIPVIYEDEIAVTEVEQSEKRYGDADLKWVREEFYGKDNVNSKGVKEKKINSTEEKCVMTNTDKVKAKKTAETTKTVSKTPVKATSASEKIKASVEKQAKPVKKIAGKWVVREKGENEFVSYLHANNGEIVLTSEIYSSADSAKKGISTIQKSILADGFQLYCDKNRNYYFKLKNANNRFLCVGETYPTKASCLSAVESVKRFANSPISDDIEKDLTIIKYVIPKEKAVEKKGYSGKWTIVDVEDMYIAQLFASNGELLLSSEAYMTINSAKSAIETITTNGIAGNFIIDVDKKGRYFFKLRNSQKSTLCVGETYAQQVKCESAIESVRRFLKTAKLEETNNN